MWLLPTFQPQPSINGLPRLFLSSRCCLSFEAALKCCCISPQAVCGRLRSGAGSQRAADQRGPAGVSWWDEGQLQGPGQGAVKHHAWTGRNPPRRRWVRAISFRPWDHQVSATEKYAKLPDFWHRFYCPVRQIPPIKNPGSALYKKYSNQVWSEFIEFFPGPPRNQVALF